jgi:hypothetical protein
MKIVTLDKFSIMKIVTLDEFPPLIYTTNKSTNGISSNKDVSSPAQFICQMT